MNTILLKYAVEVERTRSISGAAKLLNMAQPNLSKAIRDLEEMLGFDIFQRTAKGVAPTAKGNIFLDYARNILTQLQSIESLSAAADGDTQRFAITVSRGSYIASGIMHFAASLDSEAGLELDIRETNSMEVVNNVISGRYNMGLIRFRTIYEQYYQDFLQQHRLENQLIWEFDYVVLMSEKHSLADKEALSPEDLMSCTEIVHGDTVIPFLSSEADTNQDRPTRPRRQIRLYERCNQFELLAFMPSTFMWGSPLPEDMLKRYGLVQRQCAFPNNSCKDLLIYPAEYHFSTLEKKFVQEIYRARDRVSKFCYGEGDTENDLRD